MGAIKHVEDYIDEVSERFPGIDKKEIERILKHGMRSMYYLIASGAAFIIRDVRLVTLYFGRLFTSTEKFMQYYGMMWKMKHRIKWRRQKRTYEGGYYFGLTAERAKRFFGNKTGRLKKKFEFTEDVFATKIPEECFMYSNCKYFYKIVIPEEKFFEINLKGRASREIYLVAKRDKDNKLIMID